MADEQASESVSSAATAASSLPYNLQGTLAIHKGPVHVARLNSLGRYLLTGGQDRQIHLFNAANVANSSSSSSSAADDRDAASTKPIKTYSAHTGSVLAISIASDNATFVSGGEDRNVLQWDVATGSVVRRFSAHNGAIHTIDLGGGSQDIGQANNDVLATAGFDGTLRFYDLRARGAWKPMMECKDAKDAILCMAIRGANVWTGSVDGVLRTYDLRAGELREDTLDRPITSLMPSLSATSLLVSVMAKQEDDAASHIIMDVSDGAHLQTITRGGLNVQYRCRSTFWSAESTILAGDESGQIAAWDVMSGEKLDSTPTLAWRRAHSKAILWAECTDKDGGRMVTASADGTVKLWSPPISS